MMIVMDMSTGQTDQLHCAEAVAESGMDTDAANRAGCLPQLAPRLEMQVHTGRLPADAIRAAVLRNIR